MRWWGWGDPARAPAVGPAMLRLLRETVGTSPRPRPPVALARVQLPPARLPEGAHAELRALLGADAVRDDHAERVEHAAGRGYPDLVRLRAGEPTEAPDAVLYPSHPEQLGALLALCAKHSIAVVPFGGGTSVVGGVAPLRGDHAAVVALDMRELADLVNIDGESRLATVQAGMRAPALERRLAARGLTLGHFPQSFEYVSLGGCAASGGAGQASTGYGRFEELVVGIRLTAPAGEIALPARPASAAGPDLRGLLVGSEGTLGVIGELDLRVRAAPRERCYEGAFFADFPSGVSALRTLAQEHAAPAVTRLSDEAETRMSLAQAQAAAGAGRAGGGAREHARRAAGPREEPRRQGVPARARLRRGVPGDPRLRGHPGGGGARQSAGARGGAQPRRPAGGTLARRGVAAGSASRRRTCATSCSRTA